jgi:hypothetical protein
VPLQTRVDRLALEREHAEDALVDAVQWLVLAQSLQGLRAERELAQGKRALQREIPLAKPLQVLGERYSGP